MIIILKQLYLLVTGIWYHRASRQQEVTNNGEYSLKIDSDHTVADHIYKHSNKNAMIKITVPVVLKILSS